MKKNSTLLKLNKFTKNSFLSYATVIIFYAVISILMSNGGISSSFKGQLIPICAYAVMAVSLNLTVGILGDLSLGHAGFMSVGAFAGVIASQSMHFNGVESDALRMLVAIVVGIVVAAVFGIIIGVPVLRLKGDYLAIVTLAFGEIIRDILNCFYIGIDKKGLHFSVQNADSLGLAADGKVLVNGPIGATGIDKISTFTAGTILVIFTLFIVYNLTNSRAGRAIMSIRDNRIAAESVGINITKYKMMAFVTSAALAGGAGALYALNYSTVVSFQIRLQHLNSRARLRRARRHGQHLRLTDIGDHAHRPAAGAQRVQRLQNACLCAGAHPCDARHQQRQDPVI